MWRGWMVTSAVVGPLLAGCAAPTGSAGEPAGPRPNSAAPATADPLALIGSWTVTEAAEEPGAILRLGTGELSLFRACGYVMGNWRATTDGLFVGHTFGGDCGSDAGPLATPVWLRRAFGFRQDGDTQLLLDKQGETVARLLSGAQPTPGPNLAPQEAAPPVVDEAARRLLAPASPSPANLRPSVGSDLLGRWVPADRRGRTAKERPFAEFGSDGEWRGSDGCNGGFGRWMSGPAGSLLITSGPSTLMLCDGVPVPSWLAQTYRAGFDGDVLVLVNQTGRELGRLQRG
jgi:hypothetical protein